MQKWDKVQMQANWIHRMTPELPQRPGKSISCFAEHTFIVTLDTVSLLG
jgi:hypothetical protein